MPLRDIRNCTKVMDYEDWSTILMQRFIDQKYKRKIINEVIENARTNEKKSMA